MATTKKEICEKIAETQNRQADCTQSVWDGKWAASGLQENKTLAVL
ncbi:MAG: hypothetical protein GXY41_12395 [Phycisphaerae bacterium]|nr:hypothetical protein [Phycisphaerae bacterium]